MHKVGTKAHTAHGIGEIIEVDPGVRGGASYKVAGRGFSVWVDEVKLHVASNPDHYAGLQDTIDPGLPYHVNKDNSTTLPYDYTPQHHVDIFQGEQTIQPGDYEIDPDERLHASDSLTGEQRKENRPYPGPNPDLFAKSAAFEDTDPERPEQGDDLWHEELPDGPERTFDARMHEDPMHPQYGVGSPGLVHPPQLEYDDPGDPDSIATLKRQEGTGYFPGEGRHFRPAGLSDRYAHILEADDHSEVGLFRADPLGYQQRLAHVMIAGDEDALIEKFADYTNLLDSDEHLRTAAWKDVAAKAKRLRSEGAVHPEDIGPNRIMATVDGDNAQYKTLVLRGPGYAGIGKGANSATFSCTCQWGKWAFKRQFTFVGRMCSHALATLWELQSHSNKGNGGTFKSAGVTDEFKKWADDNNDGHIDQGCIQDFLNTKAEDYTREDVDKLYDYVATHHQQAPERDYDIDYTLNNEKAYKTSEILRTRPMSLTPDLREVPKNDEHEWTDVTEDDRKTTAPDQIVHFSRIMEALHRTADGNPFGDFGNSLGDLAQGFTDINKLPWEAGAGLHNLRNRRLQEDAPASTTIDPGKGLTTDSSGIHTPGGGGVTYPGAADAGTGAETLGDTKNQSLSPTDYLHPPAAADAGINRSTAPAAVPPLPGGPSAPGNPAPATPGASTPTDPNNSKAITQGQGYKVQQGDTLSDIAERAGLGKDNYQQIADQNKDLIKDPNHIETGWDLKIPGQSGTPGKGEGVSPTDPTSAPDASTNSGLAAGLGQAPPPGVPPPPAGPGPGTGAQDGVTRNLFSPTPPPPNPGGQPPLGVQPVNPQPDNTVNGTPGHLPPTHSSLRRKYAESSDANLLDKLRQKSVEPASDDLQHMDARNDEIRELVDELNDRGLDASFMVASLHYADDSPADGDANFAGSSYPNWADEGFAGSGPDPRHYISDSQSYLDQHEPDLHDVTEGDDIIKFNDSRSKPEQGPRHTSGVRPHGGPRKAVRVDPGVRGARQELQHAAGLMPENEDPNTLGMDESDPLATPPTSIEANYHGDDLVANFQRSAAAADLMGGGSSDGGGGMFSDDAIAANAQAMLRTAGRKFSPQEQRDLEEEAHILGARNLPNDDDLAGTHYLMGI